ncbi:MAG: putative ATPase involved in replication control, Cdc46/Mcm family [Halorubrum sp. J07HR59]|nr:MAG: putative ATPase involved in replication control, Cdc46/Mcm family [Halorubrum sp. J07HR59]
MSSFEGQEDHTEFFERYYSQEIARLAQRYPREQSHLRVDWSDLLRYNKDLARDYLTHPDRISQTLQAALGNYSIPETDLSDVDVRVTGLDDTDIYSPLQVTRDADDRETEYIGVRGELSKVTEPSKEITEAVFTCTRCGVNTTVPQTSTDFEEPHECSGCERQGPFHVETDDSDFTDHVKIRIETPPDETGKLQEQAIDGEVRGDLVWAGGEQFGIPARTGDRVIAYGTVEKTQVRDGKKKTRHFDEYLDVDAIEFDSDVDDVKIEEHRHEFEQLAAQPDAIDLFADSIAPQLHATPEWEYALEALVAYLFGSPRVDIPRGPTIRGDIHVLIVSDYGMGKSMVNEAIADYSPQVIKESVTGLSSDVGLLAAAVEDDFGDGQWTLEPGILVRANGGHVILDEIDKTNADLERMNDALEGQQVVDINKAGQSATFKSRCGLLATGNPTESRFDASTPISQQLGIDQSLLSRFDAIVTMEDSATREKDRQVAEAQGTSYIEAQEYEHGDREEFDHLDRVVTPEVGRAWVAHARDEVNPQLKQEHVETIRDWYADEVRTLNQEFAKGDGGDMPVPVSARSVVDVIRFAVAFARVNLREEVADEDIERAMSLSKSLVGQTFDGDTGTFQNERTKGGSQSENIEGIHRIINDINGAEAAPEHEVLTRAQERMNLGPTKTGKYLDKLKKNGRIYEPEEDAYLTS